MILATFLAAVLVTGAATAPTTPTACPSSSWTEGVGFCYWLSGDLKVPWAQIAGQCAAVHPSAQPASSHNLETDTLLLQNVSHYSSPWLGLSRADTDSDWIWADGSAIDYTHWYKQEPRDGNNCAWMGAEWDIHPVWVSGLCSYPMTFVCQLKLN